MKLILEILFLIVLMALAISLTSGCAVLSGHKTNTEVTVPPTPGVQLWQAARKSNWLVTASILGITGGVFAMMNGAAKLGTASIASASVSLFMSLAVSRFALWMAVFGLIGSVTAALFSILARRKALVEIIRGVQDIKTDATIKASDGALTMIDDRLYEQSNTTKKIISKIKGELKLKGGIR